MLKKTYKHDIGVVVDRLVASPDILSRVTDSVETALGLAGGVVQVNFVDEEGDAAWQSFSEKLACPNGHPLQLTEIEPRTFSFNAPFGACPTCSGLGTRMSVDVDLMLGDEELSIREGVLIPWTTQGKGLFQYYERLLEGLAADLELLARHPVERDLRVDVQEAVLRGENYKVTVQVEEPLRPRDALLVRVRGRRALHRAPVRAGRVRLAAPALVGVPARGAVPGRATATGSSPRCSRCSCTGIRSRMPRA